MSSRRRTGYYQRKSRQLLKRFMTGLFRLLSRFTGRRTTQAGFVFPTAVLLVLMVTLTSAALTYRAFSRSEQVITQREQQRIANIAAPAIERAKAKIEFLFQEDPRLPQGVPNSDDIYSLMATKRGDDFAGYSDSRFRVLRDKDSGGDTVDFYSFGDERRLNLNADFPNFDAPDVSRVPSPDGLDNAWWFPADLDGDGDIGEDGEIIAYSILVDDSGPEGTPELLPDGTENPDAITVERYTDLEEKAKALVTRTGPIATSQVIEDCPSGRDLEAGWQEVGGARIQNNFQINVFVPNDNEANPTFEAIEFQHARSAPRSFKWGAWFRYDLEIFPGREFNWNGAMHTDGSLVTNGPLDSHMVSSHNSCVYSKESSEITIGARIPENTNEPVEFQGQAVKGNNGTATGNSNFHVWDTSDNNPPDLGNQLGDGDDSVDGGTAADVAMNPLILFSEDRNEHLTPINGGWSRDPDWEDSDFVENERIYNDVSQAPFVDDFYRADDRWGPKPEYGRTGQNPNLRVGNVAGRTIGEPIVDIPNTDVLRELVTKGGNVDGLDGYWERQAVNRGMRIVVGQRLELGNAFGWNYDPTGGVAPSVNDPLYPPENSGTALVGSDRVGGNHEYRQRRSLRDNLAAVQGMVVYHYNAPSGGDIPMACIALTSHPGTRQTIIDSRTFTNRLDPTELEIDFFTGRGTNGWEFEFPTTVASNPLAGSFGDALENLAHFAGDPKGGAPSFPPIQDDEVHPFPYMAMWGDFALLRRIIDSGTAYVDLSSADKSTLHTAACTMGMLAYNINRVNEEFTNDISGSSELNALEADLSGLAGTTTTEFRQALFATYEPGGINPTEQRRLDLFDTVVRWENVRRGREFGFIAPVATPCTATDFGLVAGSVPSLEAAVCSTGEASRYPSLYYLFPDGSHDQITGQPPAEPYIASQGLTPGNYIDSANSGFTYNAFTLASIGSMAFSPQSAANPPGWETPAISSADMANDPTNDDIFDLPSAFRIQGPSGGIQVTFLDKAVAEGREQLSVRILDMDLDALTTETVGGEFWIADNAIDEARGVVYAFREDAVREDEIVRPGTGAANCTGFAGGRFAVETDANCQMLIDPDPAGGGLFQDPPLSDQGISLKPVDFAPDPDRRPYGFRLRTASGDPADFSDGGNPDKENGMTFVTDNSAYILGDFNLHSTANSVGSIVEEFNQQVLVGGVGYGGPFYNARTTLNTDEFAITGEDHWRPTEVLADAVTILSREPSREFVDGAIEDMFILFSPTGTPGQGESSYQNLNRPFFEGGDPWEDTANWVHEDPANLSSPIWVDLDGTYYGNFGGIEAFYDKFPAAADWIGFDDFGIHQANLMPSADNGYVNAIFVSGIVPKRTNQSYGGLHNYPRFIESWRRRPLYIAGAFLQLNFATAATGPYEQDAWEPADTPDTTEPIGYYVNPIRNWGYDVGLLYVPPAPAAERFVTVEVPRDEYYRELPVDDPYIKNLLCAIDEDGEHPFDFTERFDEEGCS